MNIKEIMTCLHHRPPYLMVDQVTHLDSKNIKTHKKHDGSEGHYSGHFPGAPVVPGAMLHEMATQSAGILITKHYSPIENYNSETSKGWALGVLKKIEGAKFYAFCHPDKSLECDVELIDFKDHLFKFRALIFQDELKKAQLHFQLVNISDDHLYQ